ncbi:phospholipase [Microbacterium amylolyticum]|uniref:Chemotaxis protein histidine kinase CheA n=1 Tax=Microbacterium amylolyticum TaxID=936337 RepID=A0ABS4ZH01_9MICO|nr:phospholipase [Microbacterium amylolyticum]MBP2436323.1 chemotaxis protein histidine kinase CheA [Microbacterium amylolyticum]
MTSHDTPPLLTPYPRPSHLRLLRKEREVRRSRITIAAVLTLGVIAAGTGTAFATTGAASSGRSVTATVALADSATAAHAEASIAQAKELLERADDSVETDELTAVVSYLEDAAGMPAVVAQSVTSDAAAVIASVSEEVEAAEAEQARLAEEARKKKEAEEAAAKKKAEEEAAAAAEALAAANTPDGARAVARTIAADTYGWGEDQFQCLDQLWMKESGWNYQAQNPSSGAYGIPQSLPGNKMASIADDWATNATTQITWGLEYISSVYGAPCGAWGHSQAVNWY